MDFKTTGSKLFECDRTYYEKETIKHIEEVQILIERFISILKFKQMHHDESKLKSPEKEIFEIYTPKLKNTTYGSDEYKQYLKEMKPALDHHYLYNTHHPEHYKNGIQDMDLIDIVEMFLDWMAATKRHKDGDIYKSIELNKNRFGYDENLFQIFRNTAKRIKTW